MTTAIIQNFEKMLAGGKDSTLLRFSLGNEYLKAGDPASAANHLGLIRKLGKLSSRAECDRRRSKGWPRHKLIRGR